MPDQRMIRAIDTRRLDEIENEHGHRMIVVRREPADRTLSGGPLRRRWDTAPLIYAIGIGPGGARHYLRPWDRVRLVRRPT